MKCTPIMRFWFSGELHHSISERYRLVSNAVEAAMNRRGAAVEISPALDEIAYLAIILPKDWSDDYPEVRRYSKKKRELECRLTIDLDSFREAGTAESLNLLQASLARIADIAEQKKIPFDRTAYLRVLRESIEEAKNG